MRPASRTIRTPEDVTAFLAWLGDMPMPYWVSVVQGEGRSPSQNNILHKWFGEIARQRGDCTLLDIKGECHQKYGLPIRLREPQWAWVWEQTGAKMPYGKQCKLLSSGILSVSSQMRKQDLSKYMDDMARDYRQQGYTLTDPEAME